MIIMKLKLSILIYLGLKYNNFKNINIIEVMHIYKFNKGFNSN